MDIVFKVGHERIVTNQVIVYMSDQVGLNFAINFFKKFRLSYVNGHEISRKLEKCRPNVVNIHEISMIFENCRPSVVNKHEISRNFEDFRHNVVNIHEISMIFEDFRPIGA